MADHDDAAGLFGFDDPAETIGDKGKGKGKGKPVAPTLRRVMLENWDSVASQVLNPYGVSHIEKLSLKRIWDAAAKGTERATSTLNSQRALTQAGRFVLALAGAVWRRPFLPASRS